MKWLTQPYRGRTIGPTARWRSMNTGLMLCLAVCTALAGQDLRAAFFAEPISGRKVNNYCVELAVTRDDYRTFKIPAQCTEILELIDSDSVFHSSIVDRRMWIKVENDCRFHEFLTQHPGGGIEDFISTYDFRNARLDEMPLDNPCVFGVGADCVTFPNGPFRLLDRFPYEQLESNAPGVWQPAECQLNNGVFFGRIHIEDGRMRCESGPRTSGIRLLAVDFADINGDGYLDAVLRLAPIGHGAIRVPLVLPLTRLSADGPLQVPGAGLAAPAE